jgi:hypothetical protein
MDLDRSGWTFVGITAGMALLDGALLATAGAVVVGAAVFGVLCRQVVNVDSHGFRRQERKLRAAVLKGRKETRKEREALLVQDLKELKTAQESKVSAGRDAALLVALGAFAFPIAGLGTAAALVAMKCNKSSEDDD